VCLPTRAPSVGLAGLHMISVDAHFTAGDSHGFGWKVDDTRLVAVVAITPSKLAVLPM